MSSFVAAFDRMTCCNCGHPRSEHDALGACAVGEQPPDSAAGALDPTDLARSLLALVEGQAWAYQPDARGWAENCRSCGSARGLQHHPACTYKRLADAIAGLR